MRWHEVDATGHVPGLAAEFPIGYRVLVDVAGNIGGMEPIEMSAPMIATEIAPIPAPAETGESVTPTDDGEIQEVQP